MLVVAALALCLFVLVAGAPVNGARRWLAFGSVTFQPSELAKLALAVWAGVSHATMPVLVTTVPEVSPGSRTARNRSVTVPAGLSGPEVAA